MREKVEPQFKAYLEELDKEKGEDFQDQTPEESRQWEDEFLVSLYSDEPFEEVRSVQDESVKTATGEIPVRIYTPAEGSSPYPVIVFIHGGGWVIGSIENRDHNCRKIANEAGAVVVSVGYRRAPENTFPAAADDCFSAARWVWEQADSLGVAKGSFSVMGDSAGGNLAAVVAQMALEKGVPKITHQFLIYPATDLFDIETPSYREFAEDHLLTGEAMQWFIEQYVPDPNDRKDPKASPLRRDNLSGLAQAYIITAGCDVLRDDGAKYADKLTKAGVPVDYTCFSGLIHGFWDMFSVSEQAGIARRECIDRIKQLLHR